MNFKTLLKESYSALNKEPILFTPKIFSAIISSTWIIMILRSFPNPSIYLYTLPIIIGATVFATFLLVEMIKNLETKNNIKFKTVLKQTLEKSKSILSYLLFILISSLTIALVTLSGIYIYSLTNNIAILSILLSLSLFLLMFTSVLFYFLPVTIGLENGFKQGLRGSISFANNYRKEVIILFTISLFLLSAGFLLQGFLELLGYAGFFLSRVVSAGISTYLFVLSSELYSEAD